MSKIDELIKQLCPDGVELKKLWEVTYWDKRFNAVENYKQPQIVRYKYFLASELKPLIVEGGDIKILTTNISNLYTSEDLAEDNYSEGEIIAIPWGGNPIIQYYNGKFLTSDNRIAVSIDSNYLNTKYLYFYLLNNVDTISTFYRGAGIKHPNMSKVLDFQIPIPPLAIQEEIVKILDAFTTLEAELEAELEARKKQYTFYRDSLLSFEGKDVEWKTLGEVGEIRRGVAFTKKQSVSGKYPVVANAPIPICYHNEANRIGECVVIARSGANAGLVSYWNEEMFLTDAFSIHPNHSLVNTKFIYYYLKNKQDEIHLMKKGGGVPHVRASDFEIYSVPILPMKEQNRIVSILDKFDALVNDISIGLPAEIEARKKQYEYYRNQLLTFAPIQN
jgi:type I restriction enzyme S subunit